MKKELKQIYILVLAVVVSLGLVVYASNAKKVQPLSSSNSSLTKLISNNVQPLNDTWGYYVAAGEDVCITGGNCLSTVTGGTSVSDWNYFDATTIKPTSTVGMFINASSTFNSTLRVNDNFYLKGALASGLDGSGACSTNYICTGGHTHVGVNETYGSGWNGDTATPEKDDIYDYLHQMDTDDDGDIDTLNSSILNLLSSDSRIAIINATTSNVDTLCIQGDCKTAWPEGGAVAWDDITDKPATSTILNLLDTQNRIAVVNSTTTNIGTLTVYNNATIGGNATTTGNQYVSGETNLMGRVGVGSVAPPDTSSDMLRVTHNWAGTTSLGVNNSNGSGRSYLLLAEDITNNKRAYFGYLNTDITFGAGYEFFIGNTAIIDVGSAATAFNTIVESPTGKINFVIGGYATANNVLGLSSADSLFYNTVRIPTLNATTTNIGTLTVITGSTFPANDITDAEVSNTLTCSDLQAASAVVADSEVVDALTISTSIEGIFTGNIRVNLINATSSLIDTLSVGTVNNFFDADCDAGNYVYGINTDGSLDCRADVSEAGAASSNWDYFDATTIKPTTTVGFFISASSTINSTLRVTGSLTAPGGITGALTGNASTASALFADPSDCAAGTVATAIAANGNLTCSITPLISGGTLTSANVCQYDGTGIDCNLVKDSSGDCASGAVCLGDHTHSSYAPTANPTFTGLQVTPDLRAAMLNSTTTKVGTLTVFTGSTLSGLSIISDGRLAVINSTTTKSDNLTVNTSATINAATLNGLSVIADGRIAMLNSTTSKIDTLIVNTVATLPAGSGPTVDAAGETAIDTTSDQFVFYGGAKRVIPYWGEKCFTMASSTWASVKTNIPLWHPAKAITITDVYCETEGGTSVAITFSDGTNALEAITCDDDGAADDGSIANGTFTANEKFEVDLGTVTGAVDYLNACITYSITAD